MIVRIGICCALLLFSSEVSASLYCVVDFSGRRCNYTDMTTCQQAAGDQGECVLNRQEMIAPVGGAVYCLVEKWKTECVYRDLASCQRQALPRKASCLANPNLTQPSFKPSIGDADGWSRQPNPESGESQPQWGGQPWDGSKRGNYLPSPGYNPRPGSR
ncbi:MAG: hypothetical protein HQL72_14415 [Magnetococcales bacterium]|nr:hypothetical protein [Magnetococcales bacterium]